jgi:hypothetical protein
MAAADRASLQSAIVDALTACTEHKEAVQSHIARLRSAAAEAVTAVEGNTVLEHLRELARTESSSTDVAATATAIASAVVGATA